jgi:hypothetical protein
MYSKCIVSPLIRTPIAMTASKGFLFPPEAVAEEEDLVRSVVEDERRSVAVIPPAEEELAAAWT